MTERVRRRVVGGLLAGLAAVAVAFGAAGTPDTAHWAAGDAPTDIIW